MRRPTLRLLVSPGGSRLRAELDGAGVVFEAEAALALRYDARADMAMLGRYFGEAVHVAEELAREPEPLARVVPAREAAWFELVRSFAPIEASAPLVDPLAHDGEVIVVHPFTLAVEAPALWSILLGAACDRALDAASAGSAMRRAWLSRWAHVSVELPALPADAVTHDHVVRALRDRFGAGVLLNGRPAGLRAPLRLSDLGATTWISAALPSAITLALASLPRHAHAAPVMVAGGALMSILVVMGALQRAPKAVVHDATPPITGTTALARYGVDQDRDRAGDFAFAGRGAFRLDVVDGLAAIAPTILSILGVLLTSPVMVAMFRSRYPGILALALGVAALALGAVLGARLASAEIAVGDRGLTLRYRGWLSRPIRIPYARVRHVIAGDSRSPRLRIFFHDDRELSLRLGLSTERRVSVLREIEALIVERVAGPASYRVAERS